MLMVSVWAAPRWPVVSKTSPSSKQIDACPRRQVATDPGEAFAGLRAGILPRTESRSEIYGLRVEADDLGRQRSVEAYRRASVAGDSSAGLWRDTWRPRRLHSWRASAARLVLRRAKVAQVWLWPWLLWLHRRIWWLRQRLHGPRLPFARRHACHRRITATAFNISPARVQIPTDSLRICA